MGFFFLFAVALDSITHRNKKARILRCGCNGLSSAREASFQSRQNSVTVIHTEGDDLFGREVPRSPATHGSAF